MTEFTDNIASGLLIFCKSDTLFGRIIRKVEGPSCNHVAGSWNDLAFNDWQVLEWLWHGPEHKEAEAWWKKNAPNVVYVFDPCLTIDEAFKYNTILTRKAKEKHDYNYTGILAFWKKLEKYYRRLTWPYSEFCSQAYTEALQEIKRIPEWVNPRLTSPQDLLRMVQKCVKGKCLFKRTQY